MTRRAFVNTRRPIAWLMKTQQHSPARAAETQSSKAQNSCDATARWECFAPAPSHALVLHSRLPANAIRESNAPKPLHPTSTTHRATPDRIQPFATAEARLPTLLP